MTQDSRYPEIKASPRCKVEGIGRPLVPDTLVGDRIIEAKFPCDPKKLKPTFKTKEPKRLVQPSAAGSGQSKLTPKDKDEYKEIEGVQKVEGMTPDDAEKKKGDCDCQKIQWKS